MKGYLLQEQTYTAGEETFIESLADENEFGVIFTDNMETGYFYAIERNIQTGEQRILDALHIYEVAEIAEADKQSALKIIWSTDWWRCALIINNHCQAVFDFQQQGGYNKNEFPPPNAFWTKGERLLTDEMVRSFFK